MPDAPLILTLAFDEATFARFDGLRRRHFPDALNLIPAHATLFHHLPGEEERGIAGGVVTQVGRVGGLGEEGLAAG